MYKDELFISGIDKNSDCKNEALDEDSNVTTKRLFGNYIILSAKINSSFYNFNKFSNLMNVEKILWGEE